MLVSDERAAEFVLRNVGGKPLHISEVRTSCMCTFAQVIIDDEESPTFNMVMHNSAAVQRWQGVVEPGLSRSEEHTSELQSLMRNSYAVFCLTKTKNKCIKIRQ